MAFERVLAMTVIPPIQMSRVAHGLGRQDFTSFGDRLRTRSNVHDRSDGREVAMGSAEFSEAEFARVETDTDAKFRAGKAQAV